MNSSDPFLSLESHFATQLGSAFHTVSSYSLQLLSILIALDIVFIGFLWMIKGSAVAKDALLKVIFISFLLTLVVNFPSFLQVLIAGFVKVGAAVSPTGVSFLSHPALFWNKSLLSISSLFVVAAQYGYTNVGVSIIYTSLGFTILLSTTAILAAMLFYILQFYVIALIQLVVLPFAAFRYTQSLFLGSIHELFAAGARICVLLFTVGISMTVLQSYQSQFTADTSVELPIGLLLMNTIVALLCWLLPWVGGRAIGKLQLISQPNVEVSSSADLNLAPSYAQTSLSSSPAAAVPSLQAASLMPTVNVNIPSSSSSSNVSSGNTQSTQPITSTIIPSGIPSASDIESREVTQKASQRVEKNYKEYDD